MLCRMERYIPHPLRMCGCSHALHHAEEAHKEFEDHCPARDDMLPPQAQCCELGHYESPRHILQPGIGKALHVGSEEILALHRPWRLSTAGRPSLLGQVGIEMGTEEGSLLETSTLNSSIYPQGAGTVPARYMQ